MPEGGRDRRLRHQDEAPMFWRTMIDDDLSKNIISSRERFRCASVTFPLWSVAVVLFVQTEQMVILPFLFRIPSLWAHVVEGHEVTLSCPLT